MQGIDKSVKGVGWDADRDVGDGVNMMMVFIFGLDHESKFGSSNYSFVDFTDGKLVVLYLYRSIW